MALHAKGTAYFLGHAARAGNSKAYSNERYDISSSIETGLSQVVVKFSQGII